MDERLCISSKPLIFGRFRTDIKFSHKWKSGSDPPRFDLRMEETFQCGPWSLKCRINPVYCHRTAFLAFLEGGFRKEETYFYLKCLAYSSGTYADRIYAYERGAPGTFSVPAYYGKGGAFSLLHMRRLFIGKSSLKVYVGANYTIRAQGERIKKLNKLTCGFACVLDI